MTKRPPNYLDDVAKRKWREILPLLSDNGQGTLDLLAAYAAAWSSWLSADNDQDRIRWLRAVRQLSVELQLSPRSRRKAAVDRDGGDPVLHLLKTGAHEH